MTLLEILEAHDYRILNESVENYGEIQTIACNCGDRYGFFDTHRMHVAQVLDEAMREAKAEALREAAEYAVGWVGVIGKGQLVDLKTETEYADTAEWLRDRAEQYKEEQ